MIRGLAGLIAFGMAWWACTPPPVTPTVDAADRAMVDAPAAPSSDTGDPTGCEAACTNLARLGCPDGLQPNCVFTCSHAMRSGLTDLHTACLADAGSVDAAVGCGSVKCLSHDGGGVH